MKKIPAGTLVITTRALKGDCGMFGVYANTIAKVIYHLPAEKEIKLVITPHDKGYITTNDRCIQLLSIPKKVLANYRFNKIPKYTLNPATLY